MQQRLIPPVKRYAWDPIAEEAITVPVYRGPSVSEQMRFPPDFPDRRGEQPPFRHRKKDKKIVVVDGARNYTTTKLR